MEFAGRSVVKRGIASGDSLSESGPGGKKGGSGRSTSRRGSGRPTAKELGALAQPREREINKKEIEWYNGGTRHGVAE